MTLSETGCCGFKHQSSFQIGKNVGHATAAINYPMDIIFKSRFRYQLPYPLVKKATAAGTLNVKVSDELMRNSGYSILSNTFAIYLHGKY